MVSQAAFTSVREPRLPVPGTSAITLELLVANRTALGHSGVVVTWGVMFPAW